MTNTKDKVVDNYLKVRRFLYGNTAIREGVNRELLVMAAYKDRIKWDWSKQTLDDCVAYLKCQYRLDPYYEKDRDIFFNS